jgi:hypothetical protein
MLYNMHVISACECFFSPMGLSVRVNLSLKYNSLVIVASKMPGNRWGRFEHGSTMLRRIQVPGALAE